MSQKFTVELDDKFTDNGYRSLMDTFKYEVNVHDLNLRIVEVYHSFDLYINNQRFVPGQPIVVVDSSRTDYLKKVNEATSQISNGDSKSKTMPAKVIFGTEQLIEADKILRSNTETTNLVAFRPDGTPGNTKWEHAPQRSGSRSPPLRYRRTGSREPVPSPLNQKVVIKPTPTKERPLPPTKPGSNKGVSVSNPQVLDKKIDNWFFDVSAAPATQHPISDLKGTLKMEPVHEYEDHTETYLPVGTEDPSVDVQNVFRIMYHITT